MAKPLKLVWIIGFLIALASIAPVSAQPPVKAKQDDKKSTTGKYLRIKRENQQPVSLETAIVRFVPASGKSDLVVDLVAAVHVGDRSYYETLNLRFEDYDVVLYELVASPGIRIPKGGCKSDNPLAMIQQGMKVVFGFDSQTELIDYTRDNFVHADLSFEQMGQAIRERGDDGLTVFLSVAADLIRQQNLQEMKRRQAPPKAEEEIDVFSLLLDSNASVKLKRVLAEQFESMESLAGGLGGTLNTILVTDRNKAAMKVFQKELTQGKKKIAIFYGAAHMPDFEKRLQEDFGMKRQSERWLTAWDLKAKKGSGLSELLKLLD